MGTQDGTGGGAGGRTVTLREEREGEDTRFLCARLDAQGNLCIEGHDMGPTVARILGGSEYEWAISLDAAAVPAYVRALGGAAGEDVLALLQAAVRDDPGCAGVSFLEQHGIPRSFWSRVGD